MPQEPSAGAGARHTGQSRGDAPALEIRDLAVSYRTARGEVQAVQGVDAQVYRGQITAVVGESGSGKSTTALAVLGLLPRAARIDTGQVLLDGRDITGWSERRLRHVRGVRIGYIPQDPNNSLNPVRTIGASVAEGLAIHRRGTPQSRRQRVLELLEQVGIDDPERRIDQYPHELSGGMKQRVLIAAAVALEPEIIIADEPTSALDVTVQKIILDLLDRMRRELDLGVLFITHDLAVAGDRADHVVVMRQGEVVERGNATRVLTDPGHAYSRQLLADAPSLHTAQSLRKHRADPAAEPLLTVTDLVQEFGDFRAVDGVSFEVPRGSTHAVVGESGSGKTTTGRAIAAFRRPTSGTVRVGDTQVEQLDRAGRRDLHRRVQLVYQNPYSSLDPRWTVGRSVAEPLENFGLVPRGKVRERVAEYLDLVALDPALAERRPAELSGGQRQRVAIARAMIVEPELVVLDEAVSALDVTVQAQILRLLDRLQRDLGLTYLFISHDLAVVKQISDTVTVMQRGRAVESGPTERVFEQPREEYTRRLIEAIPGTRYRSGALNLGL